MYVNVRPSLMEKKVTEVYIKFSVNVAVFNAVARVVNSVLSGSQSR